ncbi:hypothetical protein LHYA1_G006331 [Lachnellula hyalina]|uniref:DUF952 domain-containing protein n=1 Tax=Lachnellula hyalina TaxID=1316788 RepID=A0A8H8QZH6_9HELO|nr:uncharacterized protein LHYA1_G006331 [Lachnellula hyalina]TVY25623.1 hypothetical protein LHYA1_G006331 [Lachnellula hyalina]
MSTPSQPPKYIYKILPPSAAPPSPLPLSLPLSDLDSRDGFIHMSASNQILGTLNNFFSSTPHVYILRVPYAKVESRVKWEMAAGKKPDEKGGCWDTEGRAGGFPHIYEVGDGEGKGTLRLGSEEVESVGMWEKGEGSWSEKGWPFGEDVPKKA